MSKRSRPSSSSARRARAAAALASLSAIAWAVMARATAVADRARMQGIVREVLKDRRYQTEMPRPGSAVDFGWHLPLLPFSKVLVWSLAVVAAGLIVFWIVDALRRRAAKSVIVAESGEAAPAAIELGDAERLAAAGRFSEAAHLLLLLAFQHLARRRGAALPAASTSREIARGLARDLDVEQRAALAQLVGHVEISWFGGRVLDPGDYARCHAYCLTLVRGAA